MCFLLCCNTNGIPVSSKLPMFMLVLQGFLLATAELILTNLCDSLSDAPDQASFEDERK